MRKLETNKIRERIEMLRRDRKLTHEEISELVGISRSGYSIAITRNGKVFFTIEQLLNIKHEFSVTWDYLIEGNTSDEFKVYIAQLKEQMEAKDITIGALQEHIKLLKAR